MGERRVKIVYHFSCLEISGAARQLRELLAGLDRRRFSPLVVAYRGERMDYLPRFEETGAPVLTVAKRRGPDPLLVPRLVIHLRRERPDILHTFQTSSNRYGVAAALLARVPHRITSQRYSFPGERSGLLQRLLDRRVARWSDLIVTNSRYLRDVFSKEVGLPADRVRVIRNGFEVERFLRLSRRESLRAEMRQRLGLPPGAACLGMVARLSPEKNHSLLFRSFRLLRREGRDARLVVVGDGALRRTLVGLAEELGIARQVHFLGARQDVPEIICSLDFTVLTSTTESMPNAVVESMLCGRPVVATRVGGVPEVIEDGVTGLLVPSNDEGQLARAMTRLVDDPELTRKMGHDAQAEAAQRFAARRMIGEMEALYLSVAGI